MQKQQVSLTHTQGAVTQSIIHYNLTTNHNWLMPHQQTLQHEERSNKMGNVTIDPLQQTAFEQSTI